MESILYLFDLKKRIKIVPEKVSIVQQKLYKRKKKYHLLLDVSFHKNYCNQNALFGDS